MALNYRRLIVFLLLPFVFMQYVTPSYACGPFFPQAVYVYTNHPELPLKKFAQGNLGILTPDLAMSYLVVAYRYLSDNPLNKVEQNAVASLWHRRLEYSYDYNKNLAKPWLDIRNSVPSVKRLNDYDISFYKYQPETYQEYTFCTQSTFNTAANTLKERITKYGIKSSEVKFWLTNQDKVFQNCGTQKNTPVILPVSTADKVGSLAKYDNAYQIAAANFYAGNFEIARTQFEQIAKEAQSPWHLLAKYMVARAFYFQNIQIGDKEPSEKALLATAQFLQKELSSTENNQYKADTQALLSLVESRLNPIQRYKELVRDVLKPNSGKTLEQNLDDYTIMLDAFLASPDSPDQNQIKVASPKQMHDEAIKDDLTNWIYNYGAKDASISLRQWQTKKSIPWLIEALSTITDKNPALPELLSAAEKISLNSPAYLTVQYNVIAALIKNHRYAEAQKKLDYLLGKNLPSMTVSARNMLLVQRQQIVSSLSQCIKYALKNPVDSDSYGSYKNLPNDYDKIELSNNYPKPLSATFDWPMVQALNKYFSLRLWKNLALNQMIPGKLHNEIVASTWVRALLLGDEKTADLLTPMFQLAYPSIKKLLADYLSARSPAEKHFSACYVLLKAPGLSPYIRGGLGRNESDIMQRDEYGDNFWVPLDPADKTSEASSDGDPNGAYAITSIDVSKYISQAEKNAAKHEAKIFYSTAMPSRFITEAIIAMSKYNPADSRIPEALFIAIKIPRWGQGVPGASSYSKTAFQLLHSKYGDTKWAARAKYYY